MAKVYVKQPSEFKLNSNDDFTTWYAQFSNFAGAANIADKDRFATLCSYLDITAFTVVQGLALTEEAIISPATFKPLLEKALRGEETIPPRLALRYRTQKHDESLGEFAMSLGKLAIKAAASQTSNEETLIDTFCTGVRDTDLSLKLLESSFESLSSALQQAQKIESATNIRKFVRAPSTPASATSNIEILGIEPKIQPRNRSISPTNRRVSFNETSIRQTNDRVVTPDKTDMFAQSVHPGRRAHPQSQSPNNVRFEPRRDYKYDNSFQYDPNRIGFSSEGRVGPQNRTNMNTKRCWYCNRLGHVIRNCRTRAREQEQNFQSGPSLRQ